MSKSNIESIYPLSPMQHGMLFHCLYAPESEVYFDQFTCTLDGGLDVEAFRRAWQKVVDRHPVLRTSFVWERREKPLQVVQRRVQLPLAQHDWRALEESQQQEQLEALIQADRARGFELSKAPLMRQALIRLSDDVYQFLWSRSHLLLDGWSNPLILRDVFAYYDAYRQGKALELAAPRPYQDYIHWLQRQDVGQAERFWRPVLAGFRAPTPLGVDRTLALPVKEEQEFGDERLILSSETAAALQAFTRKHQVTLNTVAQGMWALLLNRYSGEEDVLFGGVVSGRPAELAGCEMMVGLFINTLPVRVKVPADIRVLPWLQKLQEAQAEARQYEYTPLVQLQAWSEVPRGVALFESILVFENYPLPPATEQYNGNGLHIGQVVATERTNYPLTVLMTVGAQPSLRILYQRARFEAPAIRRMLEHMQNLLEGISADPEQKLSELRLLSSRERERLLIEFNETQVVYPSERCVHELFEEQVERSPEALAVVFGEATLSYGELNRRANQLAHYLRSEGVGPDVLVGICAERSLEMVVGLLAILKAGGAYVPFDPTYPRQRLTYMIEDAEVGLLLTQQHLLDRVTVSVARQICLDVLPARVAEESRENPRCNVQAENLAYMIYTSGSTGQPKGAMNTHGGILNRLQWMQEEYQLTAADRVLQKTPFSFDVSVWEFFWPLMVGARLVVAQPGGHQDPHYLKELIAKEQVTTVHFVPSMLEVYLEDGKRQGSKTLKRVLCSGESLSYNLQQRFMSQEEAELHNLYGPTEAAIDVTYRRCARGEASGIVSIGWPIANTQIYILDKRRRLAPEGVAGEIYIAGQGLGRGYYRRPGLTAERFVANPFSEMPGARMYQTGDLGRFLAGGEIEFLGRVDHQVKIRGNRIELGEIEAVLQQHGGVQQAVVVAQAAPSGGQRLVAYVVGDRATVSTAQLRSYLSETLPDYMVPASFVWLDVLPLTPNGKVDRRALTLMKAPASEGFAAPRTPVEEKLAAIWCEVLRCEQVGIHDNFLELGGDSILSIQVAARASRAGLRLTPRDLFEHPTVAALAAVVGRARIVTAEQGAVTGKAPLTPVQRLFFAEPRVEPQHFNQSLMLELRQLVDVDSLRRAFVKVVEQHDALRLRFTQTADGDWQQFNAAAEANDFFSVVDFRHLAGAEQTAALEAHANGLQASLNLSAGPLLRVCYYDLGANTPARLLIIIHHLAVDGVSWRILLEDVASGCEQAAAGHDEIRLGAKTTSFKEWAERLREYAGGNEVKEQKEYWREVARRARQVKRLPVDEEGGANTVSGVRAVEVSLTREETSALLSEVPAVYRTEINEVLLTALVTALGSWTGERRVLLELEGHGREDIGEDVDVTRTVGWFTSVYPVVLEVSAGAGEGEALKSVKEQVRGVRGRGLGWGLLGEAEEIRGVEAELGFNYLGQFDQMFSESSPFSLAPESTGAERSPRSRRRYLVDITGSVFEGRLHTSWAYNENVHRRETIERVVEDFISALRNLIAHCQSPEAGGYTPSDFPDTDLSQSELDDLIINMGQPEMEGG